MKISPPLLSLLAYRLATANGKILSIVEYGAISDQQLHSPAYQILFPEFHREPVTLGNDDLELTSSQPGSAAGATVSQVNTDALNAALREAQPGDTVLVPENSSFSFNGGVVGRYLDRVTIDVSGAMHFVHDLDAWPQYATSYFNHSNSEPWGFRPGFHIAHSTNVTLTCSSNLRPKVNVDYNKNQVFLDQTTGFAGTINGNGKLWWDEAIMGRLPHEDPDYRPRLILVDDSVDLLIENLTLLNSPYWTLTVEAFQAEIRYVNVLVDRKYQSDLVARKHEEMTSTSTSVGTSTSRNLRSVTSWIPNDIPDWVGRKIHQPEDLNTDGIDPIGMHIWIHDCIVQNADDSIAVKPGALGKHETVLNGTIPIPCTRNVTVENMVLTGFGASIGSVGPTKLHYCVDQVTFKNITMPGTGKGIYIKSNPVKDRCRSKDDHSTISNIVYDGVYMNQPFWWPIWIGPQQQHEPHSSLHNKCPLSYPLPGSTHCPTQGCATFVNITLRNIRIDDPFISPGVILGNETNPMQNLLFDNITVNFPKWKPWHGRWPYTEKSFPYKGTFQCKHAVGKCRNCSPKPPCFDDA